VQTQQCQNNAGTENCGKHPVLCKTVDMTVLMALSTITSKQTKGTERTIKKALQELDYLATHLDTTVHFSKRPT
jgi:hypothetical protein